jgi:uncharacterized protein DUF4169
MAELINLNKARKARGKAAKDEAARHNRAAFGRTKAEKDVARAKAEKAARELDQKKLD